MEKEVFEVKVYISGVGNVWLQEANDELSSEGK
jgi:hypothetical protein